MTKQLLCGALAAGLLLSATAYAQPSTSPSPITASAPNSRYTDNGDGTVTDTTTGLMWKQCAEGLTTSSTACDTGTAAIYTWQQALQQAQTVDSGSGFAGHTDWRLPNRKELHSLVEVQCYSPAINATLFPNTPSNEFWSSSPVADDTGYAWVVSFDGGYDSNGNKSYANYVRLVRGGQ